MRVVGSNNGALSAKIEDLPAGIMQFKPSTSMPGNAGTPVNLEGLDPQQLEQWYKTQEMQAEARQQHLESRQMEAEDMDNEDGAKKATGSTVAAMKAMKKTMKKPAVAKSDMKALKKCEQNKVFSSGDDKTTKET